MLRNYLTIAIRNLLKYKQTSFINLLGLSVGIAACMLIASYVLHELSYDQYHAKSERVYRVSREWFNADGETNLHLGHLAHPIGPLLKQDFSGPVAHMVRFLNFNPLLVADDKKIQEEGFYFTDSTVFDVFSFHLLEGNPKTCLAEPFSLVLTQSAARKLFGSDEGVVGKMVNFNNEQEMKITGIMANVPENSHFTFNALGSYTTLERFFPKEVMESWGSNNSSTYLLLASEQSRQQVEAGIDHFLDRHQETYDGLQPHEYNQLHLMPLTDIHLYSHLDSEIGENGDINFIYLFIAVSVLTLVIACINFMNLSTARSIRRAKEVGIRKVVGARRGMLIQQFLSESMLLSFFSLLIAFILVQLVLPYVNDFLNKDLSFVNLYSWPFWTIVLAGTVVIGMLAGSYPAFYLSAPNPVKVLRNRMAGNKSNARLRSGLVVVQFGIAMMLVVGVGIIHDQLTYMQNKHLGFEQENIVLLANSESIYNNYENVKTELEQHPAIKEVMLGSRMPSGRLLDSWGAEVEQGNKMEKVNFRVAGVQVSHNYFEVLQVPFAAGRNFDVLRSSDSTEAIIINEEMVRTLGWKNPEEAIGKKMNYGSVKGNIVGVVKDFHIESLQQAIVPTAFVVINEARGQVAVKVADRDQALPFLKERWSYWRPDYPVNVSTVEDRYRESYQRQFQTAQLVTGFSLLALIIAGLGLYGLATFNAEQRTREIGIRKAMGASLNQLMILLTASYTRLVGMAFLLACPLAFWVLHSWLNSFAYSGGISWLTFIKSGLVVLFIAWVTVASQTIKTARLNPGRTLRDE